MNSTDALREFTEKWQKSKIAFDDDNIPMVIFDDDSYNDLLSDLTALISEHYVEREKYDTAIEAIKILNETIKQFTKENEQ